MAEGGTSRWRTGDFKGREVTPCGTVTVGTCHWTCVQTRRAQRIDTEAMCTCVWTLEDAVSVRAHRVTNAAQRWGAGVGEAVRGGRVYGRCLHPLLSVAVNLKLTLNNTVFKRHRNRTFWYPEPSRVSRIHPRAAETGYVGLVKSSHFLHEYSQV